MSRRRDLSMLGVFVVMVGCAGPDGGGMRSAEVSSATEITATFMGADFEVGNQLFDLEIAGVWSNSVGLSVQRLN